jgi:hypothetical protein
MWRGPPPSGAVAAVQATEQQVDHCRDVYVAGQLAVQEAECKTEPDNIRMTASRPLPRALSY